MTSAERFRRRTSPTDCQERRRPTEPRAITLKKAMTRRASRPPRKMTRSRKPRPRRVHLPGVGCSISSVATTNDDKPSHLRRQLLGLLD